MREQEIVNEYISGKSISELLKKHQDLTRVRIEKILRQNNVSIRGGRSKKLLTEEQINQIKIMIENGAFLKDIAEYCNLNQQTVAKRLEELDIKLKNKKRVNRNMISDYFSVIDSPTKAYWLGLLYTDSSVDHYGSTGRIRLQLQERDKELLEKFKTDLNLGCNILCDKRENSTCCSIEFLDEQIFLDLQKYNIIPRKTYEVKEIPYKRIPKEYLTSYILGLYDGDGGLSCSKDFSKDVTLSYTAYYEQEVLDFQFLVNSLINKKEPNKHFYTSAWHAQWRGRLQVISILDALYNGQTRFLKRKYDKYISLKNSLK